ncbi:MAG TPA: glycosyltransferase N-terminal domain-containing protein [Ignavibacteria bacterium]
MIKFWFFTYNILLIPLTWISFHILGLFNTKVRQGISGRKQEFPVFLPGEKVVLIHSSSLGEYQQALPLVDEFLNLNYKIVLTFFSPSGYLNAKIDNENITKLYLPFDSYRRIEKFLNDIHPEFLVLIRYDLWFNLLFIASKRNIKIILANARYDENDKFWNIPVSRSFKKSLYSFINKIFVIDEQDESSYKKLLPSSEVIRVGDSKFERVYEASKNVNKNNILPPEVINGKKVFVIGSSWRQDEDILLPVINKIIKYEKNLLTILVPHEPKETKIKHIEINIQSKFENLNYIRYSNIDNYKNQNLIIVNCIGKLLSLYSIANISYVGGGFKSGLHNVLEPAIFNIPVLFNNQVKNSDEDEMMLKYGCGILINNQSQFYRVIRTLLRNDDLRIETGNKCKDLFKETLGTAKKIIENITNS